MGSLIAIFILILGLTAIVRYLTKNDYLAYGISFILVAGTTITYFVDSTKLGPVANYHEKTIPI